MRIDRFRSFVPWRFYMDWQWHRYLKKSSRQYFYSWLSAAFSMSCSDSKSSVIHLNSNAPDPNVDYKTLARKKLITTFQKCFGLQDGSFQGINLPNRHWSFFTPNTCTVGHTGQVNGSYEMSTIAVMGSLRKDSLIEKLQRRRNYCSFSGHWWWPP